MRLNQLALYICKRQKRIWDFPRSHILKQNQNKESSLSEINSDPRPETPGYPRENKKIDEMCAFYR